MLLGSTVRPTASPDAPIRCPRCGYEQQGVIASWKAACPLGGNCTECGLEFEWGDLLNSDRKAPSWCVEQTARSWNMPLLVLKTVSMMVRPWRFWAELKMTHQPRWGRVFLMLAIMIAVSYAAFAGMVGADVMRDLRRAPVSVPEVVFSGLYAAALPLASDPPSLYVGTALPIEYASVFDLEISHLETVRYTLLTGRVGAREWGGLSFGDLTVFALFAILTVFTAPLGFIALPASRRRAKVMSWHVIRIVLYSLAIVVAVYLGAVVRYGVSTSLGGWRVRPTFIEFWHLMAWGVPLALIVWWYFAIDRYLRMPHALGVAVALVAIGMLLGPAVMLLVLSAV